MGKPVKGFLAADGTYFDIKWECERYEFQKLIEALCESHGTNYDNFMAMLNAWNGQIRGYYDADEKCERKQAGQGGLKLDGEEFRGSDIDDYADSADGPLLRTEGDNPDAASGSKDAPGFLEQSFRKHK
jgi:hypothetical protein